MAFLLAKPTPLNVNHDNGRFSMFNKKRDIAAPLWVDGLFINAIDLVNGSHVLSYDNVSGILKPAMSRFLLNIEKRSLPWFTLSGVGLASKNAM